MMALLNLQPSTWNLQPSPPTTDIRRIVMHHNGELLNYRGGAWRRSETGAFLDVINPATGERISKVPLSSGDEVDSAVQAATEAFAIWRRTPPTERIQYLFKFK